MRARDPQLNEYYEIEPTEPRNRYFLIEGYRKYKQNEVAQYVVRTTTFELKTEHIETDVTDQSRIDVYTR